jgi:hypothetical protein
MVEISWHKGVLKPTNEHKNPIFEWKVQKPQPQVLRIDCFVIRYHKMITNWAMFANGSSFELFGCVFTHECMVRSGFTLYIIC